MNKCVGVGLGKNANEWSLKRTLRRSDKKGKGEIQHTVISWKAKHEKYKKGAANRIGFSW